MTRPVLTPAQEEFSARLRELDESIAQILRERDELKVALTDVLFYMPAETTYQRQLIRRAQAALSGEGK